VIAWNAFYTYMLQPAANVKFIVALTLLAGFFFRRTEAARAFHSHLHRLSAKKILGGVLSLAFALRLFWVLWSPHVPPAPITEDAVIWQHALNLAHGVGFKDPLGEYTAGRPIGYPLFLSLLIRIFGPHLLVPELFQVLFGVLNVFCLFLIGKELQSELFGAVCALIYALYPTAVMSTKLLLDEHLFLFFWLLGIYFLICDYQKPSYAKIAIGGAAVGLSALFRAYSAFTALAVLLAWLFVKQDPREAFFRFAMVGLLTILLAAPWAIRNQIRMGSPVFYSTIIGVHLYYANNPTSDVRYPVNPDVEHGGDPEFSRATTEVDRDREGRRAAWRWIKNNPGLFLQKAMGRMFYMLGLNNEGWVVDDNFTSVRHGANPPSPKLKKKIAKIERYYYVAVFCLSGLGILLGFLAVSREEDARGWVYLLLVLALYLLTTAIALNHRKYRFVIEPYFCLFACYALYRTFFGFSAQAKELSRRRVSLV